MSRVITFTDINGIGKQTGYLQIPHSSHRSAYGWVPAPITLIRGAAGDGPRVLLLGGVHGDEYEGQIALAKLARSLTADDVAGTLMIVSSTNLPAVVADSRVSPIDGGNLNRAFPGDPYGTPTQMLAHHIEEVMLSSADYVIDLHSGGSSLDYLPCVRARLSADPDIRLKTLGMVNAFGTEFGVMLPSPNAETRTMSAACERKQVVYINPETGGGARVGRAALSAAYDGTLRTLEFLGVLEGKSKAPSHRPPQMKTLVPGKSLIFSDTDGVWEPLVELGDEVSAEQPVAAIYDLKKPWLEPRVIVSPITGTVLCRHARAWVGLGDCLFEVAVELESPATA